MSQEVRSSLTVILLFALFLLGTQWYKINSFGPSSLPGISRLRAVRNDSLFTSSNSFQNFMKWILKPSNYSSIFAPKQKEKLTTPKVKQTFSVPQCFDSPHARRRARLEITEEERCAWLTLNPTRGRLGNIMFEYAALLGVAAMNNKRPYLMLTNHDWGRLHRSFKISAPFCQFHEKETNSSKRAQNWDVVTIYTAKVFENLTCEQNVTLDGYFQSFKIFRAIDKRIKADLSFKDDVVKRCKTIIAEKLKEAGLAGKNCSTVGAHLRRGDMTSGSHYNPASGKYINDAISYFRTKLPNQCVAFFILGDDVRWNTANVPKSKDIIVLNPNSPEIDMCILHHCNHAITSIGTFSFWAGYLSPGIVTYMKDYLSPRTFLKFKDEDYYPPHWVPV